MKCPSVRGRDVWDWEKAERYITRPPPTKWGRHPEGAPYQGVVGVPPVVVIVVVVVVVAVFVVVVVVLRR